MRLTIHLSASDFGCRRSTAGMPPPISAVWPMTKREAFQILLAKLRLPTMRLVEELDVVAGRGACWPG